MGEDEGDSPHKFLVKRPKEMSLDRKRHPDEM
ncbi:uncharacterized protein G2W53_007943 [Senna tora]|uniref:Uncharacterized protein n=1 Tax=Senna tora TaxID=362788 RepID=A0A835CFD7_9FABA|nr:uncharacterized protein G2W53_007943 [Senna tora]